MCTWRIDVLRRLLTGVFGNVVQLQFLAHLLDILFDGFAEKCGEIGAKLPMEFVHRPVLLRRDADGNGLILACHDCSPMRDI